MKGIKKLNYIATGNKGQYVKNDEYKQIYLYNDFIFTCHLNCNLKDNRSIEKMQRVLFTYLHDLQELQQLNKGV